MNGSGGSKRKSCSREVNGRQSKVESKEVRRISTGKSKSPPFAKRERWGTRNSNAGDLVATRPDQWSACEELLGAAAENEVGETASVDGGNGDIVRQHLSADMVFDVLTLPLVGARYDP